MIKNNRQLRFSEKQLDGLAAALEQARSSLSEKHPRVKALSSLLGTLKRQIAEYQALAAGDDSGIQVAGLHDLPKALIQIRIARGLSQRALADRLGIKAQQVQRWEHEDYENISFARLEQVAEALGLNRSLTISSTKVQAASSSCLTTQNFSSPPSVLLGTWSGTMARIPTYNDIGVRASNDHSLSGTIDVLKGKEGPMVRIKGMGQHIDGVFSRNSSGTANNVGMIASFANKHVDMDVNYARR